MTMLLSPHSRSYYIAHSHFRSALILICTPTPILLSLSQLFSLARPASLNTFSFKVFLSFSSSLLLLLSPFLAVALTLALTFLLRKG
jgi:hypothetical protein